jgi:hypothetical protein
MRGGCPVYVRKGGSGFDGDKPAFGVDADAPKRSQVQDQAAFDSAVAGDVVPASADGQGEACAPGTVQDDVDVRYGTCPCDGAWTQIDHPVPYRTGFLILGILRFDQGSLQPPAQLVQGLLELRFRLVFMNSGHR